MKQFIIKTGLIGGCVILLLTILYLAIPVKPNHYLQAYKQKCQLLDTVSSPRIIFVGGSNLALGLDSKRIQDSLHINVINYGLHIGIGLKYMLDDVASYTQKGDILILSPEWQHFYTHMYGAEGALPFMPKVEGWDKLRLLNMPQIITIIKEIIPYLQQNIFPQKITSKTYLASNFNQYGDEVKHWTLENKFTSRAKPIQANFNQRFGRYFITEVKKLQQQCRVYIFPPACSQNAFATWQPQITEVSLFLSKEGFPFLVSPEKFVFPEEYMYDQDYHLNKKGVDLRTDLVIEALKSYVEDTTRNY